MSAASRIGPAVLGGLVFFVLTAWVPGLKDTESSLAQIALSGLLFAACLYGVLLVEQAVRRRRAPAAGRPRRCAGARGTSGR